jgi:hypothetical protein
MILRSSFFILYSSFSILHSSFSVLRSSFFILRSRSLLLGLGLITLHSTRRVNLEIFLRMELLEQSSDISQFFQESDEETRSEIMNLVLEELITALDTNSFADLIVWEQKPTVVVEQGYQITRNSLRADQFLDYYLVMAKGMDLNVLQRWEQNPMKLRFYSKYYSRKFPKKFFEDFPLEGHTFYLGSYSDMDIYILAEPHSVHCCGCSIDNPSMPKDLAEIVYQFIILEAFKRYAKLSRIDPVILAGRNLSVSDSFENFTESNFVEFLLNDLNSDFQATFATAWSSIRSPFFQKHNPKLCFIKYGQNIRLENPTDVEFWISTDFDSEKIDLIQYSIATNVSCTLGEPNEELSRGTELPEGSRSSFYREMSSPSSDTTYSVVLPLDGIEKLCEGSHSLHSYTKAFNPAFSNFQCIGVPTLFRNISNGSMRAIGLHGYSTVANVLRRTSKTEPFASRPIAHLFKSRTATDLRKYQKLIQNQRVSLQGAIDNLVTSGSGYRLEMTFQVSSPDWSSLATPFAASLQQLREVTFDLVSKYGVLVPSDVFPRCVGKIGEKILETLDPIIQKFVANQSSLRVCEKEYAVMLENLVGCTNPVKIFD